MTVSAEVLLMIAIAGLYLYDSALLLYCNEAVLIPERGNAWASGFGSGRFSLRGKELYIPNPFQMHRPLFRLSWKFEYSDEIFAPWTPLREAFFPLIPCVWSMAMALFVFFPLGFFTHLGDRILWLALILLFFSILTALVLIWFRRTAFGLSGRRFAGLAFESLVCPPFALNLIRHVAAAMPVCEDFVSAARRLQKPRDWAQTRHQLIQRLSNEIEWENTDSIRCDLLKKRRKILESED